MSDQEDVSNKDEDDAPPAKTRKVQKSPAEKEVTDKASKNVLQTDALNLGSTEHLLNVESSPHNQSIKNVVSDHDYKKTEDKSSVPESKLTSQASEKIQHQTDELQVQHSVVKTKTAQVLPQPQSQLSPKSILSFNGEEFIPLKTKSPIFVKGRGIQASLGSTGTIVPIYFNDLILIILHAVKFGIRDSPLAPSCFSLPQSYFESLSQKCNVAVFKGVNIPNVQKYLKLESTICKPFIREMFWLPVVIHNPAESLRREISATAAVIGNCGNINNVDEKHVSWEIGYKKLNLVACQMSKLYSIEKTDVVENVVNNDFCNRTSLLMSITEQADIGMPLKLSPDSVCMAKDKYVMPTSSSLLVSIDTENMKDPSRFSAVREIRNPDENKILFDCLIQDIEGTRTEEFFTERFPDILQMNDSSLLLKNVKSCVSDATREFLNKLPDNSILIAHDAVNDFNSMKLSHPFVVDSASLFRSTSGGKCSLKDLTKSYLNREIQKNSKKHNSVEDAEAALNLIEIKLQNKFEWENPSYLKTIRENYGEQLDKVAIISQSEEIDLWKEEHLKLIREAKGGMMTAFKNVNYLSTKSNQQTLEHINNEKTCKLVVSTFDITRQGRI